MKKVSYLFLLLLLVCLSHVRGALYFTAQLAATTTSAVNTVGGANAWTAIGNLFDNDPQNAATQTNAGVLPSEIQTFYSTTLAGTVSGITMVVRINLDAANSGLSFQIGPARLTKSGVNSQTRGAQQTVNLIKPSQQVINYGSNTDLWGLASMDANELSQTTGLVPFGITSLGGGQGPIRVNLFSIDLFVVIAVTTNVVSVTPNFVASISGGGTVEISGVGFRTDVAGIDPVCSFGSQIVVATVTSQTKISCPIPAQAASGNVTLEISLDRTTFTTNGITFSYLGSQTGNCPLGCKNGGLCLVNDTCSCSLGFTGADCGQFDCSGRNGCSNPQGACTGPNSCTCVSGFTGLDCSLPDCGSLNSCSGNGLCIAPNLCSCISGFQGAACAEFQCNGVICNGNQDCTGPNICSCKTGFTGVDCSERIQCISLNNCNDNGLCATNDSCSCLAGFTGRDCSQIIAPAAPNLALIIGPSVAGVALLVLIFIIIAVVLFRRSQNRPRLNLKEPNYVQYALIHSFPGYWTSKEQLTNLNGLEQMLLNDHKFVSAIFEVVDTAEMDQLSKALTFVFDHNNKGGQLLKNLMDRDVNISEDEPTLFRANSPVTKCYTQYIRLSALKYLWQTLAYVVAELKSDVEDTKEDLEKTLSKTHGSILAVSMELDPTKTNDASHITLNKLQLQLFCQKIFELLFASYNDLPSDLKWFFQETSNKVITKFPESGYKAIGAFAFLRMLCPAIAAPHVYGIIDSPPGETTQRYLVLVSKILTSVANGTLPGQKEAYMSEMTDFIVENQKRLKTFYDHLMETPAVPELGKRKSFVGRELKDTCLCFVYAYVTNNQAKIESYLSKESKKALDDLIELVGAPPEPKA